jgi:hypothetical protein
MTGWNKVIISILDLADANFRKIRTLKQAYKGFILYACF